MTNYYTGNTPSTRVLFARGSNRNWVSIQLTREERFAGVLGVPLTGFKFWIKDKRRIRKGYLTISASDLNEQGFTFVSRGNRKLTAHINKTITETVDVISYDKYGGRPAGWFMPTAKADALPDFPLSAADLQRARRAQAWKPRDSFFAILNYFKSGCSEEEELNINAYLKTVRTETIEPLYFAEVLGKLWRVIGRGARQLLPLSEHYKRWVAAWKLDTIGTEYVPESAG